MGKLGESLLGGLGGGGPFAGNGPFQMGGLAQAGGPMSGIGLIMKLMGGGSNKDSEESVEDNPGMQMFKGVGSEGVDHQGGKDSKKPDFFKRFGTSLSDQLFQNAMMGFMNRGP